MSFFSVGFGVGIKYQNTITEQIIISTTSSDDVWLWADGSEVLWSDNTNIQLEDTNMDSALLLSDGGFILLEDGGKILGSNY